MLSTIRKNRTKSRQCNRRDGASSLSLTPRVSAMALFRLGNQNTLFIAAIELGLADANQGQGAQVWYLLDQPVARYPVQSLCLSYLDNRPRGDLILHSLNNSSLTHTTRCWSCIYLIYTPKIWHFIHLYNVVRYDEQFFSIRANDNILNKIWWFNQPVITKWRWPLKSVQSTSSNTVRRRSS